MIIIIIIIIEHGGDPESIKFFDSIGVDYVSCSPYRIPIAKISCAQSHIDSLARQRQRERAEFWYNQYKYHRFY